MVGIGVRSGCNSAAGTDIGTDLSRWGRRRQWWNGVQSRQRWRWVVRMGWGMNMPCMMRCIWIMSSMRRVVMGPVGPNGRSSSAGGSPKGGSTGILRPCPTAPSKDAPLGRVSTTAATTSTATVCGRTAIVACLLLLALAGGRIGRGIRQTRLPDQSRRCRWCHCRRRFGGRVLPRVASSEQSRHGLGGNHGGSLVRVSPNGAVHLGRCVFIASRAYFLRDGLFFVACVGFGMGMGCRCGLGGLGAFPGPVVGFFNCVDIRKCNKCFNAL